MDTNVVLDSSTVTIRGKVEEEEGEGNTGHDDDGDAITTSTTGLGQNESIFSSEKLSHRFSRVKVALENDGVIANYLARRFIVRKLVSDWEEEKALQSPMPYLIKAPLSIEKPTTTVKITGHRIAVGSSVCEKEYRVQYEGLMDHER